MVQYSPEQLAQWNHPGVTPNSSASETFYLSTASKLTGKTAIVSRSSTEGNQNTGVSSGASKQKENHEKKSVISFPFCKCIYHSSSRERVTAFKNTNKTWKEKPKRNGVGWLKLAVNRKGMTEIKQQLMHRRTRSLVMMKILKPQAGEDQEWVSSIHTNIPNVGAKKVVPINFQDEENGHKLNHKRFHLSMRENFCTLNPGRLWSLPFWRHPKPNWTCSVSPALGDPRDWTR